MAAIFVREFANICSVCGGLGHTHTRCTTKFILDAEAKKVDVSYAWGVVKGFVYYA